MNKTIFMAVVVRESILQGKVVSYLDFDLQFSSLVSIWKSNTDLGALSVYRGDELETVNIVLSAIKNKDDAYKSKGGILVVDSVNTLQLLLREQDYKTDSVKANHEAAIVLSMLQDFALRNSKLLILTNITRSRPASNQRSNGWRRELIGGRMIRSKSDAILTIEGEESGQVKGRNLNVQVSFALSRVAESSETSPSFVLQSPDFTLK